MGKMQQMKPFLGKYKRNLNESASIKRKVCRSRQHIAVQNGPKEVIG